MDLKAWQDTDPNLLPKNLHFVKRSGKAKVRIESLICFFLCLGFQGNRRAASSARPAPCIKGTFPSMEKYKRLGTWDKSEKFKLSIRLSLEFRNIPQSTTKQWDQCKDSTCKSIIVRSREYW